MFTSFKNGDKVLFTTISDATGKAEGRFVGYSNLDKNKFIVEYGNPFSASICYALTCEKKPEPKKRLMTAKELAGKWVRTKGVPDNYGNLVIGFHSDTVKISNGYEKAIHNCWEYTDTPADDSSWKSVLVEE